ncbi:MAG: hypothetical protein AB7P02_14830 [Alphaproteobacteria bacterium]
MPAVGDWNVAPLGPTDVALEEMLREDPRWQWRTRVCRTYLAGFPTQDAARAYGRREGWCS